MSRPTDKLIVGLGNPGAEYAGNRHNVGFMVLDSLTRRLNLELRDEHQRYVAAKGPGFALLKPLTFMNLSGDAVAAWANHYGQVVSGAPPGDLDQSEVEGRIQSPPIRPLIICDDLALPLGSVRFRPRGSSGGQNGLASIIGCLGGEYFPRLRLGVGPLGAPVPPDCWPDYVLSDFGSAELEPLAEMVVKAVDALVYWLDHDLEATASRYNRRVRPA